MLNSFCQSGCELRIHYHSQLRHLVMNFLNNFDFETKLTRTGPKSETISSTRCITISYAAALWRWDCANSFTNDLVTFFASSCTISRKISSNINSSCSGFLQILKLTVHCNIWLIQQNKAIMAKHINLLFYTDVTWYL